MKHAPAARPASSSSGSRANSAPRRSSSAAVSSRSARPSTARPSARSTSDRCALRCTRAGADASTETFAEHVLSIVDTIPPGRVMTYGDVAATLGSRAARVVGQVMAYYGADVPWWRVVRASGHPPAITSTSRSSTTAPSRRLSSGSVPTRYRVDLRAARWRPRPEDHPNGR